MKTVEIITNPPRDEYLDNKMINLEMAVTVAQIKNLKLKKTVLDDQIFYGLFDHLEQLVGYLELHQYNNTDMWQVSLAQLANAYKGQGYGTFLYDYAIMNDKLKVLSDETNTGGPHGSKNFWVSLFAKKRYNIVGYDTDTEQVIVDVHPDMVYNEKPNMRWLTIPPGETINEAIERIQSGMKSRYVVWYGPGTTTEYYFNY